MKPLFERKALAPGFLRGKLNIFSRVEQLTVRNLLHVVTELRFVVCFLLLYLAHIQEQMVTNLLLVIQLFFG